MRRRVRKRAPFSGTFKPPRANSSEAGGAAHARHAIRLHFHHADRRKPIIADPDRERADVAAAVLAAIRAGGYLIAERAAVERAIASAFVFGCGHLDTAIAVAADEYARAAIAELDPAGVANADRDGSADEPTDAETGLPRAVFDRIAARSAADNYADEQARITLARVKYCADNCPRNRGPHTILCYFYDAPPDIIARLRADHNGGAG